MMSLSEYLIKQYPGKSRTAISSEHADYVIKIDDEDKTDQSRHFCQIYAATKTCNTFVLHLVNCPMSPQLKELVESSGGKICENGGSKELQLDMSVQQVTAIRALAETIRKIVARGQRYPISSWKWVCCRTAESLERFADNLMAFRRHGGLTS